ncbi:deoxynucleoside kinase [Terriglobus tenax]|uniref:deoxynucleoside kinase n=1 Tax=Terriglobus tenax TaxID=1111115 RepID=UPI0021E042EA|nr:deoxynucleoside kinase [Terriglobus tenax]
MTLFDPPSYIAIEGPIRVGKSTLAEMLAVKMGARHVIEPEDNPFLDGFYRQEPGMALAAQMWFLEARHAQLREAQDQAKSDIVRRGVVSDYIFEKDKLFACLNLGDDELKLYNRYYEPMRAGLPIPDLVIYLKATPDVLRTRLKRKGIPVERAVSEEYLETVIEAYEHFFSRYTASDLLVIDTSEIDFVNNNRDLQALFRRLDTPVKGTQHFLMVG